MKSLSKSAFFPVLFFIIAGCQRELPPPPAVVAPITSQAVVVNPVQNVEPAKTKPASINWLAKLSQQSNQVEYRERSQNIWKAADVDLTFLKYDALQTKSSSTAEVIYLSGSSLDVKENTLIIFDEDPGQKKKTEDRVIIKTGQLTGKTKTELWVFTDAGLVQIKAKKNSKQAEARVVVKKDNAVDIKVKSGTAQIVYKKSGEFTRLEVLENANATIKPDGKKLSPDELVAAQVTAKAPAQANLEIEFPADNAVLKVSEIEVRGKITSSEAKLLINGELVQIDDALGFAKKVTLQPGTNLIVFQLIRNDASVKFIKRSVRYQTQ